MWEAWGGINWEPVLVSPLCRLPSPMTSALRHWEWRQRHLGAANIEVYMALYISSLYPKTFTLSCTWQVSSPYKNSLKMKWPPSNWKKLKGSHSHDSHMDVKLVAGWRKRGCFSFQSRILDKIAPLPTGNTNFKTNCLQFFRKGCYRVRTNANQPVVGEKRWQ